jgi:aminobenzoyl-glutamate utilization protein B
MSIGTKGTNLAAKVLGNTALELFKNPKIIDQAKKELMIKVGDHQYEALLGDRQPPLDYRN